MVPGDGPTEMAQPDEQKHQQDPAAGSMPLEYDLKFIPTHINDEPGGGWYRELPDGQIEVMTRSQLECVPIEDSDPETMARLVVERLIKQQSP